MEGPTTPDGWTVMSAAFEKLLYFPTRIHIDDLLKPAGRALALAEACRLREGGISLAYPSHKALLKPKAKQAAT